MIQDFFTDEEWIVIEDALEEYISSYAGLPSVDSAQSVLDKIAKMYHEQKTSSGTVMEG